MRRARFPHPAFSLVEVTMVVVILGIIAAIAAPRVSKAGKNAQRDAVESTLTTVRRAMDLYFAEHGRFPGYNPANGTPSNAAFPRQLMEYTDIDGFPNAVYSPPFVYGPYVRAPFPKNPFNDLSTVGVIATQGSARPAPNTTGWIAVLSTGAFALNTTDADLQGKGIDDPGRRNELLKDK